MKISVVVPVYNVEEYLVRSITSLTQQSYKKLEIILVDDGSTDKSYEICDSFQKKDERIKLYHQENMGLSGARNTGLSFVTGDYVFFLDPDDWLDTNYFELCVDQLKKNNVDLLLTPYIREYKNHPINNELFDGKSIELNESQIRTQLLRRLFGEYGKELKKPARMDDYSTAWAKFYRASICKTVKFVDTSLIGTEDAWFNINYIAHSNNAAYFNGVYYHYFKQNSNSLVTKYNKKLFSGRKYLYRLMRTYLQENKYDATFYESLNNRIILEQMALLRNICNSNLKVRLKINEIRALTHDSVYVPVFRKFDFSKLPFTWRLFYRLCYFKQSVLIYSLLVVAEPLKKVMK